MGWVYAIRCPARGLIKVGMTNRRDYQVRLKELQTGQPERLELIAAWPHQDAERAERCMHQLLAANHYRGEWFTITPAQCVEAWARVTTGRVGLWYGLRWRAIRARRRGSAWLARGARWTGYVTWALLAIFCAIQVAR